MNTSEKEALFTCVVKARPRLLKDIAGVTLYTAAPDTLSQSAPSQPPAAVTSQHLTPLTSQDMMGQMNSLHAGIIKHLFMCIIAIGGNASRGSSRGNWLSKAAEKDPLYLFIKEEMFFPTCVSLFWAPGVHFYTSNKPWDFSRPRTSLGKNSSL